MPDRELVLLAGLIADGCVDPASTPSIHVRRRTRLVADDDAGCDRGHRWVAGTPPQVRRRMGTSTRYLSGDRSTGGNPVTELCRRHGIWGKRSEDKFVPDAIFGLASDDIARFLGDPLRLRRPHLRDRSPAADRLLDDQRAARARRAAPPAPARDRVAHPHAQARCLRRYGQARARGADHGPRRHRAVLQPRRRLRQDGTGRTRGHEPQDRRQWHERRHAADRDLGPRARRQGRTAVARGQPRRWSSSKPQLARAHAGPVATAAAEDRRLER